MTLKPARLQWSEDGAPVSCEYGDIYFQPGQGAEESRYVFLDGNDLAIRFQETRGNFRICELGFGTGLNFFLTLDLWRERSASSHMTYVGIEKHPLTLNDMRLMLSRLPVPAADIELFLSQYPPLIEGFHHIFFPAARVRLVLVLGDVGRMLPDVHGMFDAWYLDGFAPAKNPDMWEEGLFPLISARTSPGGTLATFSAAGSVRRALAAAEFVVKKTAGFGRKRDMTVAQKPGLRIPSAPPPVTVVGAGMAGAAVARAAAERGCVVTVHDRAAAPASEASGNPFGILYPKMTVDPSPLAQFHQHGFCFTRAYITAHGLPSWQPCGVTHLPADAADAVRHARLAQEMPADYARCDDGKLMQPMAGFLSPPEFCGMLLDHPRISFCGGQSVTGLSDGVTVLAAGPATQGFPPAAWLPLRPVRGQITCLAATPASRALTGVFCHDGYITPAVDGVHVTGATFQKEEVGAPDLRVPDHHENLERLLRHQPELGFSGHDIRGGRAAWRATTPDRLPIMGRAPDSAAFLNHYVPHRQGSDFAPPPDSLFHSGLYLSTGFGAHGLSGAPLAGDLIAALISGDVLPVPVSLLPALLPERFLYRAIRRS